MQALVQKAFQPGLNPAWSNRVLNGTFYGETVKELAAQWRAAPGTASRGLACLDALEPLTYRTAQGVVILADRILAAPINALAAGAGLITGSLGFAYGLVFAFSGRNCSESGSWRAAQTGAAFGYHGVRHIYTCALGIGLFCGSVVACGVGLPAELLHCLVPRVPPQAASIADFVPLPSARVQHFLEGLDGQGGAIVSIGNMVIKPGSAANAWEFEGKVRTIFGLFGVAQFAGEVTGDDNQAHLMKIVVRGRTGFNPVKLTFTPSLLHGRLQMTGEATGFHFSKSKPINKYLAALGYTKVEGSWNEAQQQSHHVNSSFGLKNEYIRFFRGLENGEVGQEMIYNGGWECGYSMGPVELKRFPFSVAAKLGMLLNVDS